MPSIHVGWALLVALVVVVTARNRWRWLVLAYPVLTTLAVVVTANHFWLDGIAAVPLLALAIGVQRAAGPAYRALAGAARRSRRMPVSAGAPEPVPADTPEPVLAGAVSAGAVAGGGVSAGGSTEPPGAARAATGPHSHAPGRPVPRPCAARTAVSAGLASRNSLAHRPQARYTLPSHEQDGR